MKYNTALPYFPEDDIEYILYEFRKLLAGEGLLSMGKYVQEFEQNFADYIGAKHAIATTSCTSAIETLLAANGIGKGDLARFQLAGNSGDDFIVDDRPLRGLTLIECDSFFSTVYG